LCSTDWTNCGCDPDCKIRLRMGSGFLAGDGNARLCSNLSTEGATRYQPRPLDRAEGRSNGLGSMERMSKG
jgi:hypothetical protein